MNNLPLRGIATDTLKLMVDYLCNDMGVQELKAFVMPENVFSEKALLRNGFTKQPNTVQGENWGGKEFVDLDVFTYTIQSGHTKANKAE